MQKLLPPLFLALSLAAAPLSGAERHCPHYLLEHQVGGGAVMPAAWFVTETLAVPREVNYSPTVLLSDLKIMRPLRLRADIFGGVVGCGLQFAKASQIRWVSGDPEQPVIYARGKCRTVDEVPTMDRSGPEPQDGTAVPVFSQVLYDFLRERGLNYGPRFRLLDNITVYGNYASGRIALDPSLYGPGGADQGIHPTVLDASMHLIAAIGLASHGEHPGKPEGAAVPIHFEEVFMDWQPRSRTRTYHADVRITSNPTESAKPVTYDLQIRNERGMPVLLIRGGRLLGIDAKQLQTQ